MVNSKITSKAYFWIALIVPLVLSVSTAIIIVLSTELKISWTKEGIDYFVQIFKIPISLIGLIFISTGAAFACYRIELSYEQNERQLEQFIRTNYNSFRGEFIELLKESDYKFQVIDLSEANLFSALYPNAKSGNWGLNTEFEDFISDDTQGFIAAMNNLRDLLSSTNGSRIGLVPICL